MGGLVEQQISSAVTALVRRAEREGLGVAELCARRFKDYPFGLRLVVTAGGANDFILGEPAVAAPDAHLSDLVVRCYGREGAVSPAQIHQQEPAAVPMEGGTDAS